MPQSKAVSRVTSRSFRRLILTIVWATIPNLLAGAAACTTVQDSTLVARSGWWNWYAGPHAVVVDGSTFVGFVSKAGDVSVAVFDEHGSRQTHVLESSLDSTLIALPALATLPDGRVLAFYARSGSDAIVITQFTLRGGGASLDRSRRIRPSPPIDPVLRDWTAAQGWPIPEPSYRDPQPAFLREAEAGVLVWQRTPRALRGQWISFSGDLGETWSTGLPLFTPASGRLPSVKLVSDGERRVHFLLSDAGPAFSRTNSVYYFFYEDGGFYRADGTPLGGLDSLPLRYNEVDVVYDGVAEGAPGGTWDIALTPDNSPVVAYARHSEVGAQYRYVTWNGFRWIDRQMAPAHGVQYSPPGTQDRERLFALSGVALDQADPRIVYVSTPIEGGYEIERMFTPDDGGSWSTKTLTDDPVGDNIRPTVANRGTDQTELLWLNAVGDSGSFETSIHTTRLALSPFTSDLGPDEILEVMRGVADWQLRMPPRYGLLDWTRAALHTGLLALGRLPAGEKYEAAVMQASESIEWKLGDGDDPQQRYNPLNHAHGQVYLDLYARHREPRMLQESKALGDEMLRMSFDEPLEWKDEIGTREWAFEDALFMTPTLLARLSAATDDQRYLDLMDRLWWKTTDYLFDTEHKLFYRDSRYFSWGLEDRFWSRGNGWVLAGLARVLPYLPSDFPNRPRYVELFRTMAGRLAALQLDDGYWRTSLLVPEAFPMPETSGTGFFVFALAWGINEGLLSEEEYLPVVKRGWEALVGAVDVNGKLGWAQSPSIDPTPVRAGRSEPYAVGAFLLAGAEIHRIVSRRDVPR